MSGIDKIIEKINDEVKNKIDALQTDSTAQIAEIKAQEIAKADAKIAALEKTTSEKVSETTRNAQSSADMECRKQQLETRQTILAQAFELAVEKMQNLDDASKVKYAKNMVAKYALGNEQIIASKSESIYTDALLSELNSEAVAAGKLGNLTYALSDDKFGGFILSKEGMQINLTYEAVIKELKQTIDTDVAKILFKK